MWAAAERGGGSGGSEATPLRRPLQPRDIYVHQPACSSARRQLASAGRLGACEAANLRRPRAAAAAPSMQQVD